MKKYDTIAVIKPVETQVRPFVNLCTPGFDL